MQQAEAEFSVRFVFPTVPNAANPVAPDATDDNAIPESIPSPSAPGRKEPEMPGNTGEQIDRSTLDPKNC